MALIFSPHLFPIFAITFHWPNFLFQSEIFWKLSNFALPPVFWHLQILNEFLYRKWTFLSDWMHFSEVLVLALALKLPMIPGGTNLEPLEKIQLGFLKEYHFVNREKIVLPISYFISLCKYFLQPKSDESRNHPNPFRNATIFFGFYGFIHLLPGILWKQITGSNFFQ